MITITVKTVKTVKTGALLNSTSIACNQYMAEAKVKLPPYMAVLLSNIHLSLAHRVSCVSNVSKVSNVTFTYATYATYAGYAGFT